MKKNRFPKISNEELNLDKIPNPEDESFDYEEPWIEFALTMNAYEVCGNSESAFETRDKVFKDPLNASLTELRCAFCFTTSSSLELTLSSSWRRQKSS